MQTFSFQGIKIRTVIMNIIFSGNKSFYADNWEVYLGLKSQYFVFSTSPYHTWGIKNLIECYGLKIKVWALLKYVI